MVEDPGVCVRTTLIPIKSLVSSQGRQRNGTFVYEVVDSDHRKTSLNLYTSVVNTYLLLRRPAFFFFPPPFYFQFIPFFGLFIQV